MELDPPGDVFWEVLPALRPQAARTQSCQLPAVAREVGLVGVAGVQRGAGEVAALVREEPLEAQHALKHLRAVANCSEESPAQLALAEADVSRQPVDSLARVE